MIEIPLSCEIPCQVDRGNNKIYWKSFLYIGEIQDSPFIKKKFDNRLKTMYCRSTNLISNFLI